MSRRFSLSASRPPREAVNQFSSLLQTLVLVVASGSSLGAQAQLPPLLELRVPKPPTVATAEHGSFLVYELHVTNFAAQPMTLRRIEVTTLAERRVLLALSDSLLLRAVARPGTTLPPAERPKLSGGTRAVVFLWVPVDRGSPPASLGHRVTVERGADSLRTEDLDGAVVPVAREAATIGPPLRGGPWLTGNGPAAETGHRRALIPVGGTPAIAQRFAIDYVKVGDDHLTFSGDRLKNASYHAYGSETLAVADGIVVATKDGIPENIPGPASRAVPITLETVGGNHVIVDIGGGRHAFYAHLQPGSLRVRLGDRVRKGQVLGLVGNSGNSTEPHLHFHVSDGTSPLGSEGLPYGYESFEIVGRCRAFNTGCERSGGSVRRGEVPLGNVLVQFSRD